MKRLNRFNRFEMVCLAAVTVIMSFASPMGSYAANENSLSNPSRLVIEDNEGDTSTSQTVDAASNVQEAELTVSADQIPLSTAAFGQVSTPVTDSSSLFGAGRLTMLANHDTAAQNLAVIIENGQGGLIVVDGGWRENADYVLQQIKARGGHVQAWLLTHPDSDHVGALADILLYHKDEITIDGIYLGLQEDSWYQENDSDVYGMVLYLKNALMQFPAEKIYANVSAGQVIEAGPARIQVLNSSYAANTDYVNNSSVAYLVSLNGTNVVFLGDMAKAGGRNLMENCDLQALNCTAVQLAHHGQNGVDYEVYKALKPEIALWSTPLWLWDNDNGGGAGSGPWKTLETKNWMTRLGVRTQYCTKDGDQVIE
jgi:beta-lactamase superfamily II metal-dependent hydrolase